MAKGRYPARGNLEAKHITKSYGSETALRDASLLVHPGEMVAITGPSGSGKSTLLHCLSGILKPDGGGVWFAGHRIDSLDDDETAQLRRSLFGILFQFGQLIPELTALENVGLPLLLRGERRMTANAEAQVMLERMGVGSLCYSFPTAISGGQAQRVAMARALVTDPAILFADEPTGALDTASSQLVLQEMVRCARDSETAIILVTHEQHVASFAQRTVRIQDGFIVDDTRRAISAEASS